MPARGEDFSFTKLRDSENTTKEVKRRLRKLGFSGLRPFHDLRCTHETLLLDAGVPVHVVAARCGHDPAVLLRSMPSGPGRPIPVRPQQSGSGERGARLQNCIGSNLGPRCQSVHILFTCHMTNNAVITKEGRVAEWFKAAVLKTARGFTLPRGFESHPFRQARPRLSTRARPCRSIDRKTGQRLKQVGIQIRRVSRGRSGDRLVPPPRHQPAALVWGHLND